MKQKIVLASQSPFRKKLLQKLVTRFTTKSPLCDEELLKNQFTGPLEMLCAYLAKEKALSLKDQYPKALIIGSDQGLLFNQEMLGKGQNFKGAFAQLKKLSGKKASLITSVYIYNPQGEDIFFENTTKLFFKSLKDQQIKSYITKDKPYNCAGSFMIEKNGVLLFEKIESSDPTEIEGLPLMNLSSALESCGVKIF